MLEKSSRIATVGLKGIKAFGAFLHLAINLVSSKQMARKSRKQRLMNDYLLHHQDAREEISSKFDEVRAIIPRNANQADALNYLRSRTLTLLSGPPGTAKTLLATYAAYERLRKREVEKVYYVKPVVEVFGERGLGFLPGTLSEKVEPHVAPLRDALGVFLPKGKADYLLDKKTFEFMPIEHLRGRSLSRCVIIADEMQNASTPSVMTILTRLGENSSIAVLGDVVQRDLGAKFGRDGLSDAVSRLRHIPEVGCVEFGFSDIERSSFVQSVICAYADLYHSKV